MSDSDIKPSDINKSDDKPASKRTELDHGLYRLEPEKVAVAVAHHWPNLTKAAEELGVWPETLHHHKRRRSPWFMAIWDGCKDRTLDRIKGVMAESASNPKGFLDRAMILRAYEPDTFNPVKVVKIEGYKMTDVEASHRQALCDQAVDAEITKSYLDRKDQRELKAGHLTVEGEGSERR